MVLVAKDIVEKEFLCISSETTALEAARQMKARRHGFAIIDWSLNGQTVSQFPAILTFTSLGYELGLVT